MTTLDACWSNAWFVFWIDEDKKGNLFVFAGVLQWCLSSQEFYNNNATDELSKVQSQIDGVKEVMVQNIDKIIGRGEKIEMLVQKSEGLNDSALEVRK